MADALPSAMLFDSPCDIDGSAARKRKLITYNLSHPEALDDLDDSRWRSQKRCLSEAISLDLRRLSLDMNIDSDTDELQDSHTDSMQLESHSEPSTSTPTPSITSSPVRSSPREPRRYCVPGVRSCLSPPVVRAHACELPLAQQAPPQAVPSPLRKNIPGDLQDGLPASPSDSSLWDKDLRRTALLRAHLLRSEDRHIHSAPHALSKEQAADSAQPVGSRLCTSVPRGLLQASHPLCNAAPAALQRVRHLPFEGSNLSSLIEAAMQG